ncbi:hypothetical protein PLESTM_000416800 [Pleodorina starrii]|nr:hypothetical protein PLESTM_000416800 [Pleodorina starrii]
MHVLHRSIPFGQQRLGCGRVGVHACRLIGDVFLPSWRGSCVVLCSCYVCAGATKRRVCGCDGGAGGGGSFGVSGADGNKLVTGGDGRFLVGMIVAGMVVVVMCAMVGGCVKIVW